MNDSVKSTIVLTAICLVVTALLAAVNHVTAPLIEQAAASAAQESLKQVLPEAQSFEQLEKSADAPESVLEIYKDTAGAGYAITLSTTSQYSEAPMRITVGIGADGKITNAVLTNYSETKDFGADYPSTYIGQDSALSGVDLVAGVTYSSTAFKNAISDAYTALFAVADVAAGEKSDDQLAAEAMAELLPATLNNAGVCEVSEDNGLFVSSNRAGYAMVVENDGAKTVYVADAFGGYVGFKSADEAAEDSAAVESLTAAAAEAYAAAGEKSVSRIQKIYEDAQVSQLVLSEVNSTVNGAYRFTSGGSSYFAFTASPFGYGGVVELLVVVDENGAIAKFKVISHNETEYYGAKVSESSYTKGFEGAEVSNVGDDVAAIAGCTFTTNAVKTALSDVSAAFTAAKEVE